MLDKLDLNNNEYVIVDTANNSISVLCFDGKVDIKKDNSIIAELLKGEIFTLPINTGQYQIIAEENSVIYLFRVFVF